MLEPVFSAVEKLVIEFSWKRVIYILLIATLAVVSFALFEWYTAYFRLARLEKSSEILQTLVEIEAKVVTANPKLVQVYGDLSAELEESTYPRHMGMPEMGSMQPPPWAWIAKFLAGAFLWWCCVLLIPSQLRNDPGDEKLLALVGLLVLGVIGGGLGLLVPSFFWPWVNLGLYPIISFYVGLVLLAILSPPDQPSPPT